MSKDKTYWLGAKCPRCNKENLIKEKQLEIDNHCQHCGRIIHEWYLTKVKH